MPDANNKNIEDRLAALRKSYLAALPEKIAHIKRLWQMAMEDAGMDGSLQTMQHAAHTLSGSGATFGVGSISSLARSIDDLLLQYLEQQQFPGDEDRERISNIVHRLEQACRQAATSPANTELSSLDNKPEPQRTVYLVEDDKHTAEMIAAELAQHHYDVSCFDSLDAFKVIYRKKQPAAVIMDMVFPDNSEGGADAMRELTQVYSPGPPLVFISTRDDIEARLAAVRVGANRYFTKPLNIDKLVQNLGGLINQAPHIPYRVLVVDDDGELADYYASLLHGAGMLVKIITEPLRTLAVLEEWQPDLVMMDVYMPECTGLELASIIRQDDKYSTMPIVFLSSELDVDKQLYALDLGGDAFLTKPVEQQQLLSTVIARVKRSRWLSRLKNDLEISLHKNELQRKQLEKKEERLRFSQYFANLGTWDLNLLNQDMYWSEKIAPLLGYDSENINASYDAFMAAIHPDDKQNMIQAMEACRRQNNDYEIEHRVIWPDGSVHWLLQKGDVIRNGEGRAVRMLGVVQDTTRRKQLERDLATQKEFAVQANNAKSEFLSRMSHELRTPMNAIIGFAQLLESDSQYPLSEHQHDSLREILKAGNHLLELIDEVLDLAKIEAGKIQLNIEKIPIIDILLESYSMMIPMAEASNIQLEFEIDGCEHVMVSVDRTKLKQVMFNLISNAIKYNQLEGRVSVSCEKSGRHRVRMNVTDTGIGIPSQRQSELFKAFNRLGAENSSVEGTGIGLMISKKIVEMMGGEIGFQSEQGKGSVFWVEISILNEFTHQSQAIHEPPQP